MKNTSIAAKIILVVVISNLITLLAVAVVISFQVRDSVIESIKIEQGTVVRTELSKIDRFINERMSDVKLLAKDTTIQKLLLDPENEELYSEAKVEINEWTIYSGPWSALEIYNSEGEHLVTDETDLLEQEEIEDKAVEMALKGELYYSDFIIGRGDEPTMSIAVPIKDETKSDRPIIGVALGLVSWPVINEIVAEVSDEAYLFNTSGVIIATGQHELLHDLYKDRSDHMVVNLIRETKNGNAFGESLFHSGRSLFSYAQQTGYGDYYGSQWGLVIETSESEINKLVLSTVISTLIVSLFIPSLGIVLLILLFNRLVLLRLENLNSTAKEITLGQLNKRAEVKGNDELSELASSFNKMTDRLVNSNKETEELNKLLKLLNKMLRHDLLNDLSVLSGNLELYFEYGEKKVDLDETLKEVQVSANNGIDFIHKMRELESAITSGKDLKKTDIASLVKNLRSEFPELAISLTGDAEVAADAALESVFANFFRNAIVHGKAKSVYVDIETKDGFANINISDDGKGIPEEAHEKLFTEGYKYGETGHTGLGLYIIKSTVERYGGKVEYINDKCNGGACFYLKLPLY